MNDAQIAAQLKSAEKAAPNQWIAPVTGRSVDVWQPTEEGEKLMGVYQGAETNKWGRLTHSMATMTNGEVTKTYLRGNFRGQLTEDKIGQVCRITYQGEKYFTTPDGEQRAAKGYSVLWLAPPTNKKRGDVPF